MALKMTPAEALTQSLARIAPADRPAADVWAALIAAAQRLASADDASLIYTLLAGGAAGWAKPPPAALQFPRDHALHLDAGPEWYWLTANLAPVGGGPERFGLVVCLHATRRRTTTSG
jgi:predicted secreted hydrolase